MSSHWYIFPDLPVVTSQQLHIHGRMMDNDTHLLPSTKILYRPQYIMTNQPLITPMTAAAKSAFMHIVNLL